MKKTIYLMIILFVSISFIGCDNDKKDYISKRNNDLVQRKLKGSVKYIEETENYISYNSDSTIRKEIIEYQFTTFNKDGFIIKEINSSPINRYSKNLFRYNYKGNLTKVSEFNSKGIFERKYIYKYDSKGNITELRWYNSDYKLERKYFEKYDSNNNLIESICYNIDYIIFIKFNYKYY